MSLDNIDNWDDELTELAEEAKKDKGRVKKIEIKEAIKKNKAYAEKTKEAIKKKNQWEYERLERLSKPQKTEIDSNKVYLKLRDMNEKDYPIYDTIIRRAKSGRKHSYLESYINFINRYFKELVRDDK